MPCVCLPGLPSRGSSAPAWSHSFLPPMLWGRADLYVRAAQHDWDLILLEVCAVSSNSNTDNRLTDSETSTQTICL